jgi:hypothetical protein
MCGGFGLREEKEETRREQRSGWELILRACRGPTLRHSIHWFNTQFHYFLFLITLLIYFFSFVWNFLRFQPAIRVMIISLTCIPDCLDTVHT